LVAVTPASGFVYPSGGLIIGALAGIVCYVAVSLKPVFKYDDSLDAFGVHGVGGFFGAVLTGVFCFLTVNSASADRLLAGRPVQVIIQLAAALVSAVFALGLSFVLVKVIDQWIGFTADEREEIEGLDRSEHGEVGFDLGLALESAPVEAAHEPRPALAPPNG